MWFGMAANLKKLSSEDQRVAIGSSSIEPSSSVRNLGVYLDSQMTMKEHEIRTARICFHHIRRLWGIRQRLNRETTARLVSALIISRLDYCNAALSGLPAATLQPLQRVMNAAARLVLNLRPRDHITAALRELHWLPVQQRILFKTCLLVHLSLTGRAPSYLSDLLTTVSNLPNRRAVLRSADRGDLYVPATRLKLGERAFSVAGPLAWNRLPLELRTNVNTTNFKRQLKTYLYQSLT